MKVLGISAYYHDSAAALIADGDIVAAAQEERFTRKKHDPGFPSHAVDFCLRQAGITLDEAPSFLLVAGGGVRIDSPTAATAAASPAAASARLRRRRAPSRVSAAWGVPDNASGAAGGITSASAGVDGVVAFDPGGAPARDRTGSETARSSNCEVSGVI